MVLAKQGPFGQLPSFFVARASVFSHVSAGSRPLCETAHQVGCIGAVARACSRLTVGYADSGSDIYLPLLQKIDLQPAIESR